VYESVKEIQKLESRPARNFTDTDDKQNAITPDVYVIKDGEELEGRRQRSSGVQRLYVNETLAQAAPQGRQGQGVRQREAPQRAVAHSRHRAAPQARSSASPSAS
jgi:DNA-directed RNA polymerase specialized sigma54-like protein